MRPLPTLRGIERVDGVAVKQIGAFGKFVLFDTEKGREGWTNFKLVGPKGKKRNWWLGWNGERLARNADAAKLAKWQPDVLEQVVRFLRRQT